MNDTYLCFPYIGNLFLLQDVCGILLQYRAFINAKSRVGLTSLHMAAQKGYTKLCLFLIQEHNAFVDVVTLVSNRTDCNLEKKIITQGSLMT